VLGRNLFNNDSHKQNSQAKIEPHEPERVVKSEQIEEMAANKTGQPLRSIENEIIKDKEEKYAVGLGKKLGLDTLVQMCHADVRSVPESELDRNKEAIKINKMLLEKLDAETSAIVDHQLNRFTELINSCHARMLRKKLARGSKSKAGHLKSMTKYLHLQSSKK
jgi:hypothetical protein